MANRCTLKRMVPTGWWLIAVLAQPAAVRAPTAAVESAGPSEVRTQVGKDEVVIGRYKLRRQKGGGYRADTEVFVAKVAEAPGCSGDLFVRWMFARAHALASVAEAVRDFYVKSVELVGVEPLPEPR